MEDFNFDFKIIFWIIAIGVYIFTQIREVIKKAQKSTPAQRSQVPQAQRPVVKVPTYTASSVNTHKPKLKRQTYKPAELNRRTIEDDLLETERARRDAFFTETHTRPKLVDYDDSVKDDKGIAAEYAKQSSSLFGVDEHLEPYTLKNKTKHPLLTFLSDKNNLRNAFISSEIFNRRG